MAGYPAAHMRAVCPNFAVRAFTSGPAIEQQLDDVHLPEAGSRHERRFTVLSSDIWIRAVLYQKSSHARRIRSTMAREADSPPSRWSGSDLRPLSAASPRSQCCSAWRPRRAPVAPSCSRAFTFACSRISRATEDGSSFWTADKRASRRSCRRRQHGNSRRRSRINFRHALDLQAIQFPGAVPELFGGGRQLYPAS